LNPSSRNTVTDPGSIPACAALRYTIAACAACTLTNGEAAVPFPASDPVGETKNSKLASLAVAALLQLQLQLTLRAC
jgi:hypothetical protein